MPIDTTVPLSPGWWLVTLAERLADRWKRVRDFGTYYDGENRLAFASVRYRTQFEALLSRWNDNFSELVVDAVEERLNIEGFRFGDESPTTGDDQAWEIWQANEMDAGSQLAHLEALIHGGAYALVWAAPGGGPAISVEHPSQCFVAVDPADRRTRLAGLKLWTDDSGAELATVYLPKQIWKFKRSGGGWEPREVPGEAWPLPNPLDRVPLVPLANRPRMLDPGRSDLTGITPIQDAVTKLAADMLVASEFSAFLQRWATGVDLPLVFDDDGNPVLDEQGRQVRSAPSLEAGPGATWFLEGSRDQQAQVGAFPATQLDNYVRGIDMLISHLSAKSRVPAHYFLVGNAQLPSGQSIRSAEAGLAAKVRRKHRPFGEGWEEVLRLSFAVKGDKRAADMAAETIWGDAQTPTVGEEVDAATKKLAMGIPLPEVLADLGYSPKRIARVIADADPWKPDMVERCVAAQALVAAGSDPAAALRTVGLDPAVHQPLLDVTFPAMGNQTAGAA